MTRSSPQFQANEFIDPTPSIIACNVEIAHHQLRDLLQPAEEKGKVLFVNRLKIDSVDFATKKPPSTFCTLEFTAVCLTTGSGLVAAGGQQSELEIRPLLPPPASSNELNADSHRTVGNSNGALAAEMRREGTSDSLQAEASTSRQPAPHRWHLRTPTGGSINNSICIQPDVVKAPIASTSALHLHGANGSTDADACRHREKRRREVADATDDDNEMSMAWSRDDPRGRLDAGHTPTSRKNNDMQMSIQRMEALLEHNQLGAEASEGEKARRREEKKKATETDVFQNSLPNRHDHRPPAHQALGSMRVLVSNNDQSVKEFRLRPPIRRGANSITGAGNSSSNGDEEKLDTRWYGLSRLQTVEFPTCINHSSFSPNGRHLVSVGDTPDVFLYSVDPVSGDLSKISVYTASSDASFSTAWSPDGLRFAVASQDGIVSIWDVRSASKIASLKTSQTTADVRQSGSARVVKWSPRGNLLAFTEHTNYFHVVETDTFTTVQRIKVPATGSGRHRDTAHCSDQEGNNLQTALNFGEREMYDGEDQSSALATSQALLESTSPARFASAARNASASNAANTSRPWSSARRYRDIGNSGTSRSPLDRALLPDWPTNRRGSSTNSASNTSRSHAEVYIDNGPPRSATRNGSNTAAGSTSVSASTDNANNNDISAVATSTSASADQETSDPSNSMLFRTVENIMTTFENETGVSRGSHLWSMGGLSRRMHRSEEGIDISGMTWDPDGEFLYVSTLDLVAQYSVNDLRRSFGSAAMR